MPTSTAAAGGIRAAGVALLLSLLPAPAWGADFGKHPSLQDLPYSCSKEVGKDVTYEFGYDRGAALAQIDHSSRREAVVTVNEDRLYRTPPAVVALELFGACGRVREEATRLREPQLTFDADCWAAATLRRMGYWSRGDFEEVVDWFLKGGSSAADRDGPSAGARAKNLYGCAR